MHQLELDWNINRVDITEDGKNKYQIVCKYLNALDLKTYDLNILYNKITRTVKERCI
jgi:hypothetical protein